MYLTKRTYISPDLPMADQILENPALLFLMEHFGIDFIVHDKTVAEICRENQISERVFVIFANLYNGFPPKDLDSLTVEDIPVIIAFLQNSHNYYKNDKYPEIRAYINQMFSTNDTVEIRLVEKFFTEYFKEVTEHLDYEEKIVFPYISELTGKDQHHDYKHFSAVEYQDHHTDIETKLTDLKNLLLKHIEIKGDRIPRRKLLISLFELEFDLGIHSMIEEKILIPLINRIEASGKNG